MRSQGPQSPTLPVSSRRRLPLFRFRTQRKEGLIRGKLRVSSPPGACLVLGALVVLAGVTVALIGYWPYRAQRAAMLSQAGMGVGLNDSQSERWALGSRGAVSTVGLLQRHRMRLLGPVIVGVGLFIVLCANSVMYENRDRETRLLVAAADLDRTEPKSQAGEGVPLSRQESALSPVVSLHSCEIDFSSLTGASNAGPQLSSGAGLPPTALLTLSSCPITASVAAICGSGGWDTVSPAGRYYSLSSRTAPIGLRKESSSDVCLNMVGLTPWPPGSAEEWTHCSWPRLDLGGARRYLKLVHQRESLDKLL